MRLPRTCKQCGKPFEAQKEKQFYCCRACFKQSYSDKKKFEALNSFPLYKCPKCHNQTKLSFDPTKKDVKWSIFKCPWCSGDDGLIEIIIYSNEVFVVF